jgi:regulator of sigma D
MFTFNSRPTEERAARDDARTPADAPPATGHDPALIAHLVADHALLKDLLGRLEDLAIHRQYARIPGTLQRLRDELVRHIAEEDTHFYGPVLHALADNAPARQRLERAHARMAGIARLALLFVKHYDDIYVTISTREAFMRDLDVVESLLSDRIELEEMSLYTLYERTNTAAATAPQLRVVG